MIFYYFGGMKKIMPYRSVFILLFVQLLPLSQCRQLPAGDEWHQWRGPDRSGTWYNGPRLDSLSPDRITQHWEIQVGPGYSGPTVAGGLLYVMDFVEGAERVLCVDAGSGRSVWTFSYPVAYNVGYPVGPRTSVQVFDGKAYSFGTMGDLFCFDARSGKVIWQVDGQAQYGSRIPTWGLASNPLMDDGKLIVQMGGAEGACLVAFDLNNGGEIWRALDEEASYSTPVLITQAGEKVLACWTGESITGLDPDNGRVFWSIPFRPGNMIMNVVSPVYDPPYLFLSGFFDGSYLLRLDQERLEAELVYHRFGSDERHTEALHCCISTPFIRDGYVYGIDSYGEARCLELITGDRIWEDLTLVPVDRWANVHFIPQGERVWGFNETGELLYGEFTPSGYRDLGRVKVIDPVRISPNPRNGVCWAHPAFVRDRIFLRNDEKLICIQVNNR